MSEISINDLQCSRIKDLSLAQQQLFFDDFKSPRNEGFQDISNYACSFSTDIETLRARFFKKRPKFFNKPPLSVSEGVIVPTMGCTFIKAKDITHIMLFTYANTEFMPVFSQPKEV